MFYDAVVVIILLTAAAVADDGTYLNCTTNLPVNINMADKDMQECKGYNCTEECYDEARLLIINENEGTISDHNFNYSSCECFVNGKPTPGGCEELRSFTESCFINECTDRWWDKVLDTPCKEDTGNCSDNTCWEAVNNQRNKSIESCHCYDQDENNCENHRNTIKQCLERAPPTESPTETNKTDPNHPEKPRINIIVIICIACASVLVAIVLTTKFVVHKGGRRVKRSGDLSEIMPYVQWGSISPLGYTKYYLQSQTEWRKLAKREPVFQVGINKFGMFGKFGQLIFPDQHVVMKIFSEQRKENHRLETGIFEAMDMRMAEENNIISVFIPRVEHIQQQTSLLEFLNRMIHRSPNMPYLKNLVNEYYSREPLCLILNYCNKKSLKDYLDHQELNLASTKAFLLDTSRAIAFLHGPHQQNVSIIHSDIKTDNIFVQYRSGKLSFVLGDFGYSVKCTRHVMTLGTWSPTGYTPTHAPPEWVLDPRELAEGLTEEQRAALEARGRYPMAFDMYQFGLVIWQGFTRTSPWTRDQRGEQGRHMLRELFKRDFFVRPPFPKLKSGDTRQGVYEGLQNVAKRCWHHKVDSRPSASDVHQLLQQIFDEKQPKNLKRYVEVLVLEDFSLDRGSRSELQNLNKQS